VGDEQEGLALPDQAALILLILAKMKTTGCYLVWWQHASLKRSPHGTYLGPWGDEPYVHRPPVAISGKPSCDQVDI